MTKTNKLLSSPPYEVEQNIKKLGENIRIARLRRNLTIKELAEKIGTGRRAVSDAENGKITTSIAVYVALLWVLGLIDDFKELASPEKDVEGYTFALLKGRERAKPKKDLDNDF